MISTITQVWYNVSYIYSLWYIKRIQFLFVFSIFACFAIQERNFIYFLLIKCGDLIIHGKIMTLDIYLEYQLEPYTVIITSGDASWNLLEVYWTHREKAVTERSLRNIYIIEVKAVCFLEPYLQASEDLPPIWLYNILLQVKKVLPVTISCFFLLQVFL